MGQESKLKATRPVEYPASVEGRQLGELLKSRRSEMGITQANLAKVANVERTAVSRLETGTWATRGDVSASVAKVVFESVGLEWNDVEPLFSTAVAKAPKGARKVRRRQWTLYGVAPAIEGRRSYSSIDLVRATESGSAITGQMVRITPPNQAGLRWQFNGLISPDRLAAFLMFQPPEDEHDSQFRARGVMCIERGRVSDLTAETWTGKYTRWDPKPPGPSTLLQNDYYWTNSDVDPIAVEAFGCVALLDFDNTLAPGWVIDPWMSYLAENGLPQMEGAREKVLRLIDEFNEGTISHNLLATKAGVAYAQGCAGVSVELVSGLAVNFARRYFPNVYKFATELVDHLVKCHVEPILVTGVPLEVAVQLGRKLGINRVEALALETKVLDETEIFTGAVLKNHGTENQKSEFVEVLITQHRAIKLGIGDSSSDVPLWDEAEISIQVGNAFIGHVTSIQVRDPKTWDVGKSIDLRVLADASWNSPALTGLFTDSEH